MWNYKDKSAPKITPDFKGTYIVDIKGKEAITVNGLLVIAHEKGIKSLKTKILQFPNKDNNNTAIVEATLIGYDYDPITDNVVEVEYTSIGDANPENCNKMVATAFIRMAETRAIGRVLRNYTNVGMVAAEELSSVVEEYVQMITPEQINIIAATMKKNGITREQARTKLTEMFNKSDLRALTEQEANMYINALKEMNTVA